MSYIIKSNGDLKKTASDFLKSILEKGLLKGILAPKEIPSGSNVFPTFITDVSHIEGVNVFAPVMPVSVATQVSKMTRLEPFQEKVGVVIKPCDLRNFIELLKFNQIERENIIIIGTDCMGVYPVNTFNTFHKKGEDPTKRFFDKVVNGDGDDELRRACRTCKTPVPNKYADIVLGYIGGNGDLLVYSQTDAGNELLTSLGIPPAELPGDREEKIKKISDERGKYWEEVKAKTTEEVAGIDNLLKYFETCIDCHNCKDQCPICFCKECFWESPTFEFRPSNFMEWGEKKGAVKMPTDTLFFHLGRMSHMTTSCNGCGFCEDACPQNIELQRLFYTVGNAVQAEFDYHPGEDLEQPPPLTTFREDELQELGE